MKLAGITKEKNKVRAAYHRASYLKERRRMREWQADHMDSLATGSNVVPLRPAAA